MRKAAQSLAIGFVIWTGWTVSKRWTGLPPTVQPLGVIGAFVVLLVGNALAANTWILVLRQLDSTPLATVWLQRVYQASNLGRYVPGKAALPAIRISALQPRGVAIRVVVASIGLELVSWMMAAGLMTACVMVLSPASIASALGSALSPQAVRWLGALGVSGLALTTVVLTRLAPSALPARLGSALGLLGGGPLLQPRVLLSHGLYWTCWLGHGMLLLWGFGGQTLAAAAAFVVAPVLGFLALVAPAGAGVREAVVIALVSPVSGASSAVAIALCSRGLSLGADVAAWLVTVALTHRREPPPSAGA